MMKVVLLVSFLCTMSLVAIALIALYYQATDKIDVFTSLEVLLAINLGCLLISVIRDSLFKDVNATINLLKASKVVVPKGKFLEASVKADTELYQNGIIQTNALPKKQCVFVVGVEIGEFQKAPLLSVSRTYHSKTVIETLNKGRELFDKGDYTFPIIVKAGELVNFKFNSDGIVKKFAVEEFYVP